MRRREFIRLVCGSVALWPGNSKGQSSSTPVVGYLDPALKTRGHFRVPFHEGLRSQGFLEGQNVALEYRSADGKFERLSALAADLVRRRVDVIAAASPPAALAARRATQTIPIVFTSGADPVRIGLVSSFNRPSGNATGFYILFSRLAANIWRYFARCCQVLRVSLS